MKKVTFANCEVCKTLYVKKSPTQRYCCEECKAEALVEYKKKQYQEYLKKKKGRKPAEKHETVLKHCKHADCKYRGKMSGQDCCDYILISLEPRGCEISKCDKYRSGRKEKAVITF